MLSRWVPFHGRTPQSWYILNASRLRVFSDTNFTLQYSLKIRGKAVSLATVSLYFAPDHWSCSSTSSITFHQASNWACNTALAFTVPPGLSTIAWKTYLIFGAFNFIAFLQVYFMFPETVGRSLEEVEDIFNQGHTFSAWKIGKDARKKTMKGLNNKII